MKSRKVKNRNLPRPFDTLAKGISSSESEDMLSAGGNGVKRWDKQVKGKVCRERNEGKS